MKVILKHNTPLHVCSDAIRKCYSTEYNSDTIAGDTIQDMEGNFCEAGPKDKKLIDRVANINKHASTIEHLVYSFDIEDISRGCLQEFARHRIASPTVKSSRYTLKELKDEKAFILNDNGTIPEKAKKYIVLTGEKLVDECSLESLENLRVVIALGIANDNAKYCMPEAYKTKLAWTINARSLQNFLVLRNDKHAHWEIQKLAKKIYLALPDEHKYLFTQSMLVTKKKAERKAQMNQAIVLVKNVYEEFDELYNRTKLGEAIALLDNLKGD